MPVCADTLGEITVRDQEILPRTGDVIPSETTGFTTRISSEVLERPGVTLSRILSREAGVQIRQSGGLGSYSSVTLRGSSSDQVMIYLDGLLLNTAAGGGFNLSNIEMLQADSIDLYRGSTPIQLSKASLGGAINIRSREAGDKPELNAIVGAGSFASRQLGLLLGGKTKRFNTLLSAHLRSSDNDFPYRNDNATRLNSADDFNDVRKNSETEQASLLLKLGKAGLQNSQQDAAVQYFSKNQQIPDRKNSSFNTASLDTETVFAQFSHRQDGVAETRWNTKLGLNASHSSEKYQDLQSLIGLGKQHNKWTSTLLGINNYWEHIAQSKTFSISGDFRHEKYHSRDLRGTLPDSMAKRDEFSLALQESLFFNNDRLLLSPSIRYRRIDDDFKVFTESIPDNPANERFSHRNTAPQFGIKYKVNNRLNLHGNLGSYQRVPSFFELFGDRGLFLGNNELKPESGINFDIGLQWQADKNLGFLAAPIVQISLFHNDIEDAISRVYNARGIGKSVNIPGALTHGIEWDLNARINEKTRLQFKGTLQDTRNRDAIPAFHNKQLPGQARQAVSVYLHQRINQLHLYYEFIGKFNRYYDTANLLPAEDQTVHNIGLKYQYKYFELALELSNFSNDIYEDFNGFPKPGRAIYMTVSFSGEPKT